MSGSLHFRVLDALGRDIVDGRRAPDTVLLAEALEHEFGVSRSVIREAVRVLQALGLVVSTKNVGIRVLGRDRWNLLDPTVIGWRLAGDDRGAQLRALTELRRAVEPLAAELAAERITRETADELLTVASAMATAGLAGDVEAFLELDIRFHRLVIGASGNEMLTPIGAMIEAVLRGRTAHGLQPVHPDGDALARHGEVAAAIARGDGAEAASGMRSIVNRTYREVEHVWRTPASE